MDPYCPEIMHNFIIMTLNHKELLFIETKSTISSKMAKLADLT